MFRIELVYESGKRYYLPIDIVQEALGLTDEDMKKVEVAVLKEIAKL